MRSDDLDGENRKRAEIVKGSANAVFQVATGAGVALEDLVVLVADEHDRAARYLLEPLGHAMAPEPSGEGEVSIVVLALRRPQAVELVRTIDHDMAGILERPEDGKLTVLCVAFGGAQTAMMSLRPAGQA